MKTHTFLLLLISLPAFVISSCGKETVENTNTIPPVVQPSSSILHQWDFETMPEDLLSDPPQKYVSFVPDPLDSTNKVMKVLLPRGEYRMEVSPRLKNSTALHYFNCDKSDLLSGDEFWLGIRILKPQQTDGGNPVITQIGPINNPTNNPGVTSAGHFQLQWAAKYDKWRWREFQSTFNPNTTSTDMVTVNYGVWEKFVLHCKFRSNSTGLMEVWRNGVQIYRAERQNGTTKSQTRIVWGVYTGIGNVDHNDYTCYYDDVKIGNRNSSYNEVAPK